MTVLDSHVPARYVKNGYTILSNEGRILEVVPRALTEEEIRERDRLLADKQQKEKEQKMADHNLLRIYSTPEDVIRARDTKIASVDSFIKTSQENLSALRYKKQIWHLHWLISNGLGVLFPRVRSTELET